MHLCQQLIKRVGNFWRTYHTHVIITRSWFVTKAKISNPILKRYLPNSKPMFVVAQIIVVAPFLTLTLYKECIQKCAFSGKLKGSSIQGKMQKSLSLLQQNYRSLRLFFLCNNARDAPITILSCRFFTFCKEKDVKKNWHFLKIWD